MPRQFFQQCGSTISRRQRQAVGNASVPRHITASLPAARYFALVLVPGRHKIDRCYLPHTVVLCFMLLCLPPFAVSASTVAGYATSGVGQVHDAPVFRAVPRGHARELP